MIVSIDKLEAGMKVARDVVGPDDAVLLPAGSHLNAEHLRKLKEAGVDTVHIVEGASVGNIPEVNVTPEARQAAEERINERFKHVTVSVPSVELIRDLAIRRLAAQLSLTPPHDS